MKNKYLYGALTLAATMFASCEVTPWEDEIPGIVSVGRTGIVTLSPYSVGETYDQSLAVVKAGMSDMATTVRFSVEKALLDSVNRVDGTHYEILPSDCYQFIEQSVSLPSGVRVGEGLFRYDPDKIAELGGFGKVKYVLPLIAQAEGLPLNGGRSIVIYGFNVLKPDVRMIQSSEESFTIPMTGDIPAIKAVTGVLFNNKWDINLTFAPDGSVVDEYNKAIGANYQLLPSTTFTLDPVAPALKNGSNTTTTTIKITREQLALGSYILPLKLTGVSKFDVYADASTATFLISYPGNKIDKKGWTITANTEEPVGEPTGGGRAIHLIDDDVNTYWHAQWQGGSHALPHILVIDMKKNIEVGRIDLARRPGQAGVKYANLDGSLDGESWTSMGEFNIIQTDGLQPYIVKPMTARYIRMTIPEKQGGTVAYMSELTVFGREK